MQKIKLVVIDIDETLIKPAGTAISEENREAVAAAQRAGVFVTLATGRIYTTASQWAEILNVDIPVIACNGADIRRNHKTFHTENMPDDAVKDLVAMAREYGVYSYLFSGDDIFCTPKDYNKELFEKWQKGQAKKLPVVMQDSDAEIFSLVAGNVQKMLMWANDDKSHRAVLAEAERFSGQCDAVCGERLNIEVNKKGVSKARAIGILVRELGVTMDEVMAIGDSGNDVEMLRQAGIGVVVKNAMPEAKAAADFETASCEENGVAEAIRRFVL